MLHLNLNQKKYGKIFLELRYKEIFSLPEKKFKILDKLTKKYPEYNADSPDRISLMNQEKQIQVHIHINRLVIDWDAPTSIQDFNKISKSVIQDLKTIVQIESPTRIGVRTFLQFKSDSQKEVENYIFNKYFSSNAKSIEILGDEMYNPRLQLSGRRGKNLFNLAFAYQQEQILEGELHKPMFTTINNFFSVDADIYREGSFNINSVNPFLDEVGDFLETPLINYIKKVEG